MDRAKIVRRPQKNRKALGHKGKNFLRRGGFFVRKEPGGEKIHRPFSEGAPGAWKRIGQKTGGIFGWFRQKSLGSHHLVTGEKSHLYGEKDHRTDAAPRRGYCIFGSMRYNSNDLNLKMGESKMAALPGKKKDETLAIVGNGFDLAHGFHTDYQSFVAHTADPSLDRFRELCENEDGITTWYLFEENIGRLSSQFFLNYMAEDADYDAARGAVTELKDTFQRIHPLLAQYLRQETARKPVKKLASVKKYLKRKTKVLTFNYTDTVQAYTKNIYHVHGSLKEENILLGYDARMEPCLAGYEDIFWSKDIRREALDFQRYLKGERGLEEGGPEYSSLMSSMESYQNWGNSGRGIDDEVEAMIPDFSQVNGFFERRGRRGVVPGVDLGRIRTVVVLGHGIEADRAFLTRMLRQCRHLKKVVIFRYDGESDSSFEEKAAFFRPYCKRIRAARY